VRGGGEEDVFKWMRKKQSIKNVGKVLQSTIRMTTFTKLYGKLLNYLGQIEVLREKLKAKSLSIIRQVKKQVKTYYSLLIAYLDNFFDPETKSF
jgi:hypothetical protein